MLTWTNEPWRGYLWPDTKKTITFIVSAYRSTQVIQPLSDALSSMTWDEKLGDEANDNEQNITFSENYESHKWATPIVRREKCSSKEFKTLET